MSEQEIEKLKKRLNKIEERNLRVEADKAWETSWFRIGSITIVTYFIATAALYGIGVENSFLGAIIPTLGFFLSVQSLPLIKKWWIARRQRKR